MKILIRLIPLITLFSTHLYAAKCRCVPPYDNTACYDSCRNAILKKVNDYHLNNMIKVPDSTRKKIRVLQRKEYHSLPITSILTLDEIDVIDKEIALLSAADIKNIFQTPQEQKMKMDFSPQEYRMPTKNQIIGVVAFTSSDAAHNTTAKELQEVITEAFADNPEVAVLNRSKALEIEKELNRQKGANYVKGKTVAQDKAAGAQILITGTLTNIMVEQQKIGGPTGVKSTKGSLSFALEAIDVARGERKSIKTFDLEGMDAGTMSFSGVYTKSSDVEAGIIRKNKDNIKLKVRGWVNELFPPELKIISIDKTDKKGLPDEVIIAGGNEAKLEVNMLIDINENEAIEYNGKILNRAKFIGQLKVLDIQGDMAICRVLAGKDVIKRSITDEKVQLMINYDNKIKQVALAKSYAPPLLRGKTVNGASREKLLILPKQNNNEPVSNSLNDPAMRYIITYLTEIFQNRDVNPIFFDFAAKENSSDDKQQVIKESGADIYMEVDLKTATDGSGANNVSIIITCVRLLASNMKYTKTFSSSYFQTDDYEALAEQVLEKYKEEIINMIIK